MGCPCRKDPAQHRHPLPVVMAEGLPVGGDEQEPVPAASPLHLLPQPIVDVGRIRHPEGERIRQMPVAHEGDDLPTARQPDAIRPRPRPQIATHLLVREDGEANALRRHDLQRLVIHRHLREPHPVRAMAEAVGKAGDAPAHLADLIAAAGQWQDRVVDRLGQAIANAVDPPVIPLGGDDALVGGVGVLVQPAGKRAPQVETDAPEVARLGVGCVALGGDALVPVGVRRSVRLSRNAPGEGVRSRGLVEVPVDTQVAVGHRRCDHHSTTIARKCNEDRCFARSSWPFAFGILTRPVLQLPNS